MVCPFCSHTELKVLDSRPARDGKAIRRRRECDSCGRRFTTFEEVERVHPMLVKRDGSRQEFDREKLLRSIMIPTRKRNVPTSALVDLVDRIEARLFENQEVTTRELGQWVLDELAGIDAVAFIRFASVYHEFDEPDQFVNLVRSLPRP
jgi:transcriptional repressor NrdR